MNRIETALTERAPVELPLLGESRKTGTVNAAAVAMLLSSDARSVLLIKRAKRKGDPWSGHMSFPGGRHEEHDTDTGVASLQQTAERETWEEVGLMLADHATLIGRLDDQRAHTGSLLIRPFVYLMSSSTLPEFLLDPGEVEEALWAELEPMRSGENATEFPVTKDGMVYKFPGYRVASGIVWGLTYRMLGDFFKVTVNDQR